MTCIGTNTRLIRALTNQLYSLPTHDSNLEERKQLQLDIFKALEDIDRHSTLVAEVLAINIELSKKLVTGA